jgi:hypothetical protein
MITQARASDGARRAALGQASHPDPDAALDGEPVSSGQEYKASRARLALACQPLGSRAPLISHNLGEARNANSYLANWDK